MESLVLPDKLISSNRQHSTSSILPQQWPSAKYLLVLLILLKIINVIIKPVCFCSKMMSESFRRFKRKVKQS